MRKCFSKLNHLASVHGIVRSYLQPVSFGASACSGSLLELYRLFQIATAVRNGLDLELERLFHSPIKYHALNATTKSRFFGAQTHPKLRRLPLFEFVYCLQRSLDSQELQGGFLANFGESVHEEMMISPPPEVHFCLSVGCHRSLGVLRCK